MLPSIDNPQVLADAIVAQAVAQPTSEEQARAQQLAELMALRITTSTVVEEEKYALSVDGVGFFALGDIHGLKGKQKTGKSAVLKVCAAALLCGQMFRVKSELTEPTVLFLDTEQKASDVKLIIDEIKQMTPRSDEYIDQHLYLYSLRRKSYDSLLADTRLLIETIKPQVVFIDGLVDYVASFNDEVMSRELIHDLMQICEEHGCAIVNVLHENKAADDPNMRGHLGSVLSQKAGSVLQCQKAKSGIISVSCTDARHGNMPTWNIRFNDEGHLVDADAEHHQELQAKRERKQAAKQEARELVEKSRLEDALHIIAEAGGTIARNVLTKRLEEATKLSRSQVSKFITKMVKDGKLCENGKMITASPDLALPF